MKKAQSAIKPTSAYFTFGRLALEVHPTRDALGRAAALAAATTIRAAIALRGAARVIFACAPSQNEFLDSLIEASSAGPTAFNWKKVTAFHMDDYVGLTAAQPQSFRHYLDKHLLGRVSIGTFHPIQAEEADIAKACAAYTRLLAEKPIDLICMGIGENGHIAFNDPPVADFEDTQLIKQVELDPACRRQQVNDGCFPTLAAVPKCALSLTVTVFRRARQLSIHVPGPLKAKAVRATVRGPITTKCPASILRLHPNATLHVDAAAARLVA